MRHGSGTTRVASRAMMVSTARHVDLARGPEDRFERFRLVLEEDGTLLVCRTDGLLADPHVVARVPVAVARLEDGLWESRLRVGVLSLPVSAGEREAVARLLAGPPVVPRRDADPDRAWRRAHLEALRAGKTPRRRLGATPAARGLRLEEWRLLIHPDRHPLLDRIFEQLWPPLLSLRGKTDRDAHLHPRHEVDPRCSSIELARQLGYAADVLGIACPRLFLRTDVPGGITALPVYPLASLSGNTLLHGYSTAEQLFVLGHHLAGYATCAVMLLSDARSVAELLAAALRIAGAIEDVDPSVERLAMQLASRMRSAQVDALSSLCAHLSIDLSTAEREPVLQRVVERWLTGVERTCARAGLLVCDELATALRMVAAMGGPSITPGAIEDLESFWLSDELSALRRALGW